MNKTPSAFWLLCLAAALSLGSCTFSNIELITQHTRYERDVYTVTTRDTIVVQAVTNAPGQRDNGVVYPSSRVLRIGQDVLQYDSLIERKYPDFIRLGLFESVGLVGTSPANVGLGSGLFGVFGIFDPEFATLKRPADPDRSVLFTGGIYRFGIMERRLRWFEDDPDWTLGNCLYEALIPRVSAGRDTSSLIAYSPFYLRKRFYLREKIPYVAITAAAGLGIIPSQYVNLSASLDVGSMGGLNFRAYAGFAGGGSIAEGYSSSFPYFGLGVSTMDFLNRVPETYREWKDHEHSSWDVGFLHFGLLISSADAGIFSRTNALKGMILRATPVALTLPFGNNRFYAGTSLINIVALGLDQWGAGILPLRFGYWHTLLQQELIAEPFIELNYYPSAFVHIGANFNINFPVSDKHLKIMAGFIVGNAAGAFDSSWADQFGTAGSISGGYIGVGIGLSDHIFSEPDLRYTREQQP